MNHDDKLSIEARDDALERRILKVGSTDTLVSNLSKSVTRNERVTKFIAVATFLIFSLALFVGVLVLIAIHNVKDIDEVADRTCAQSRQSTLAVNTVLETLVDNVTKTRSLPPDEQKRRIASYEKLIVKVRNC